MQENYEINGPSSQRKKFFIKTPLFTEPLSSSFNQKLEISNYYKKKYGLDIIVNFKNEYNKMLQVSKEKIYERAEAIFNQSNFDYVGWILNNKAFSYLELITKVEAILPKSQKDNLTNYLSKHQPKLNVSNISAVNEFLLNLSTEDKNLVNTLLKEVDFLPFYIAEKELTLPDDDSTVALEIRAIQSSLKNGEAKGYTYTNGLEDYKHAEVLLITEKGAFKPVSWGAANSHQAISIKHAKHIQGDYFDSDFSCFIKVRSSDGSIYPAPNAQATGRGCWSLGNLYLKEYLKEGAQQFYQDTFSFTNCCEEGIKHYICPSARVLAYSQSETFNIMVKEMLMQDKITTITYKNKFYTITPIRVTLEESLAFLKSNQPEKQDLIHQIEKQLTELPAFRKRWLMDYEKQSLKRMDFQQRCLFIENMKERDKPIEFQYRDVNLFLTYKSWSLSTQTIESLTFRQEQKRVENSILVNDAQVSSKLSDKVSEPELIQPSAKIQAQVGTQVLDNSEASPLNDAVDQKKSPIYAFFQHHKGEECSCAQQTIQEKNKGF